MKHPSDNVLKVIDQLEKWKLSQIEYPNYLDIMFYYTQRSYCKGVPERHKN